MKHFENLTAEELLTIENAVPQIAILVAGADGVIDADEKEWAKKLTHIRGFAGDKWLNDLYDQIDVNFSIQFNDMLKKLPTDVAKRQQVLSESLAKVNPILAKLDQSTAYKLYHSYVTYAEQIAKASGGLFGFGTISRDEKKWLSLSMIAPVSEPVEDADMPSESK